MVTSSAIAEANAEIDRLRTVADAFRRRGEDEPGTLFPAHAEALLRQASLLAEIGDAASALAAVEEAVSLYRAMAEADAVAFTAPLASALNALSNRLGDVGETDKSAAVADEAVATARDAFAANGEVSRFILVSSLINLAGKHLRDGATTACLEKLTEAAELFKQAGAAGTSFLGPMIEALHRGAMAFAEVGLWGEAVDARRLILSLFPGGPPPAMVQLLGLTLQQAAMAVAADGRLEIAQRCADEAVELARLLYGKDPEEYRLALAQSLGIQGGCRHQSGDVHAALDVTLEAVNLFHQVVNQDPAGAVPSLILTLGTLSALLTELGMEDQAVIVEEQRTNLRKTLDVLLAGAQG